MWAFSGAMDYLQDAKNPVVTLTYEWTGNPIKVDVLSPSSQIYNQSTVLLTFTTSRPMDWAAYSLDGADNVTLRGIGYPPNVNTTLTGLPYGEHSLTLYVSDSWENIDSQTVSFTVDVLNPTPSPSTDRNAPHLELIDYLLPIGVIVAVIFVLSALLYRRTRKTSNLNQ